MNDSSSGSRLPRLLLTLLAVGALVGGAVWYFIVPHERQLDLRRNVLTPERLRSHCEDHIGPPRVEEVTGASVRVGPEAAVGSIQLSKRGPRLTPTALCGTPQPPTHTTYTEDVFVAIGYDLANTILIRTAEGHVVVDVAMSPGRARPMRAALEEKAGKAPIHSIIYTHSHVVRGLGVVGNGGWGACGSDPD